MDFVGRGWGCVSPLFVDYLQLFSTRSDSIPFLIGYSPQRTELSEKASEFRSSYIYSIK